ncbi:hypothetical protein LJR225_005207 [Phenylobacterium sp. LjRoot225]
MRLILKVVTLAAALALAGCGKPAPQAAQTPAPASAPVPAKQKCPDPDIRDMNNPCSPYYYKPTHSKLGNTKKF